MIKIHCHTNLDLNMERWPESLPAVPRIGDDIQSLTVHDNNFQLLLKVVAVRWKGDGKNAKPYIELSCRNSMSIQEFYKWYAPLVGCSAAAFI